MCRHQPPRIEDIQDDHRQKNTYSIQDAEQSLIAYDGAVPAVEQFNGTVDGTDENEEGADRHGHNHEPGFPFDIVGKTSCRYCGCGPGLAEAHLFNGRSSEVCNDKVGEENCVKKPSLSSG